MNSLILDSSAAAAFKSPLHRTKTRVVFFVSEDVRKLEAVEAAINQNRLSVEIVGVVCDRPNQGATRICQRMDVPLLTRPRRRWTSTADRHAYDRALAREVDALGVDLVILTWWMHIFSSHFLQLFPQKVINVHPALPGHFPGAMCTEESHAAIQAGEIADSGVMVHYAIPEVDAGPVIATRKVSGDPNESLAAFEERLIEAECALLVNSLVEMPKAGWIRMRAK